MFKLLSRRVSKLSLSFGLSKRDLSTKPVFLRNIKLRYESKLMSIKDFVLKENIRTNGNIEWNELVTQMTKDKLVDRLNCEHHLMSAFLMNNESNEEPIDKKLFESLVNYIRSVPTVVNNSIAASLYCHFISHFHQFIEDSDIQMIRQMSDQFMAKYSDRRLTVELLNPILIGLSKSSKDNCLHSIKLLDQLRETDYTLIQQILDSTLNLKLIDEMFKLIEKYPDIKLDENIVSKIINTLCETKPKPNQTIKLLEYLSRSLIVFDSNLISNFNEIMKKLSFKTSLTSVPQNGLCLTCDQKLSGISAEQQKDLIKDFHSVVFNEENDIILKSFPEFKSELKNFDRFLRKITEERPLDLVIDGLNIAFLVTPLVVEGKNNLRKFTQKYPVKYIENNFIKIFAKNNIEKYENVLIIGRNHMKNWKQLNQLLDKHRDRISMFYAMNKTQDDCYILYAALHNSHTYIVSEDLYRDFCEKMSQKGILFERWLKTHQILVPKHNRIMSFPDQFDHKIHISKDHKTIHIPFHSKDAKIDWFCYQKS